MSGHSVTIRVVFLHNLHTRACAYTQPDKPHPFLQNYSEPKQQGVVLCESQSLAVTEQAAGHSSQRNQRVYAEDKPTVKGKSLHICTLTIDSAGQITPLQLFLWSWNTFLVQSKALVLRFEIYCHVGIETVMHYSRYTRHDRDEREGGRE